MRTRPASFTVTDGGGCWIVRCRCGAGWLPRKDDGADDALGEHVRDRHDGHVDILTTQLIPPPAVRTRCRRVNVCKEARMEMQVAPVRPASLLSTRKGRIRYDLKSVIRRRAKHQERVRERARAGHQVVGRFALKEGKVMLEAVEWDVCCCIDRIVGRQHVMTNEFRNMARWNTRQAARQWLLRNPDPRCQVVNLEKLKGRE